MVNKISAGLCVCLAVFLAGCGRYQVKLLRPLCKSTAQYKGKKDGVSMYVGKLERKEARDYFNGAELPFKKTMPLILTVKNESPYSILISRRHISLPLLNEQELMALMERSVAAPLLAGMGTALVLDATTSHRRHGGGLFGSLASGAAVVAGAAGSVSASSSNETFAVDLRSKMLHEETLWPGEEITKVVFASRELFRMPFTIRVCQMVENANGKVVSKRVIPFKVNFFSDEFDGEL